MCAGLIDLCRAGLGCVLRILIATLLGGGSLEGLVRKKVSRVQIAVVPEVPASWKAPAGAGFLISWMRSSTSNEALTAEEVVGMGNVEGRNLTGSKCQWP